MSSPQKRTWAEVSLKDCEIFGSDCAFVISARRGVFDHTGGIHFEL